MFIIAEKLVQLHGLKQNKVYTPGKYIQFFKFLEGDWPGMKMKEQGMPSYCFIGFWFEGLTFHMVPLAEGEAKVETKYTIFL